VRLIVEVDAALGLAVVDVDAGDSSPLRHAVSVSSAIDCSPGR
jgi:hypothetical protein